MANDWLTAIGRPDPEATPMSPTPRSAEPPTPFWGGDTREEQGKYIDARTAQMGNTPWGSFGTYGNWAQQFVGAHGRAPMAGDEADFWDSQLYAQREGRAPTWGEWRNRWETGDWNEGLPWQVRYPGPGRKYYGPDVYNWRGARPSTDFMIAQANPSRMPWELRSGFTDWLRLRDQYPPPPKTAPIAATENTAPTARALPASWAMNLAQPGQVAAHMAADPTQRFWLSSWYSPVNMTRRTPLTVWPILKTPPAPWPQGTGQVAPYVVSRLLYGRR